MHLLSNRVLEDSPVVANCRMNRERNLYGSNGYDRDLRIDPLAHLRAIAKNGRSSTWLDLCCGTGRALTEAARIVDTESLSVRIVGVDLAGMFDSCDSPALNLHEANLNDWKPPMEFDLITCVHGLHYVGDKLGLVRRASTWLKPQGRLLANLDLDNIRVRGYRSSRVVSAAIRENGFEYSYRHRLISRTDRSECDFGFLYVGADDEAGPNYTGQPAVNSWYERRS